MLFDKLNGIDKEASRLVYGTTSSANQGNLEKAFEEYEIAYENGFRIFDTANSYGKGEETLGKWLEQSGHREDVILLDKGCNPTANYMIPDDFSGDTIRSQMKLSLERLRTEYTDLYMLHRDDPAKPLEEIVDTLNELREEGKIKRFGGSNWTMDRIKAANAYAEAHGLEGFSVCGPNYTYVLMNGDPWGGSVTLAGNENQAFRDYLKDTQMPVFNYSAIARGYLSGKFVSDPRVPIEQCLSEVPIMEYHSPANVIRLARMEKIAAEYQATVPQIAIAWLMAQPMNLYPLVAPTGEKHVKEIVKALEIQLTEEQMRFLDAVVE